MGLRILFNNDFFAASVPDLVPTPYASVTEDALNDVLYNATDGVGGGPCQQCSFGGTGSNANGVYSLTNDINVSGLSMFLACDFKASDVLTVAVGSVHGIMRFRDATTNIATVRIKKTGPSTGVFQVRDEVGATNTDGTAAITVGAFQTLRFELDGRVGAEAIRLTVDGVSDISVTGVAAFTAVNQIRLGGIGAGAIPIIGSYYIDNARWWLDRSGARADPRLAAPIAARMCRIGLTI